MIDLTQSMAATPRVHSLPSDPGRVWIKDSVVAIEAPPDDDVNPRPEAVWSPQAKRSGICGAVSPRILALPNGGFRMYYSQILPRPGFPAGANDYDNSSARILSAASKNGEIWIPEAGVRLSPEQGGAGDFRVVSSEVVPVDEGRRFRMYFECCTGPQSITNSIRSAISTDGLDWALEPGERIQTPGHNFASPRVVFFPNGRSRMYYYDRGHGIVSAVSNDGLNFEPDPGIRIAQNGIYDSCAAFACEVFQISGQAGYVMYYAGYSRPNLAQILRAVSDDGLLWRKDEQPVLLPGPNGWDAVKCSEMCLIKLPNTNGSNDRYRMFYEACDGTSPGERGVWRIASATTP